MASPVRSHGQDAAGLDATGQRSLLVDEGSPVVWAFVASTSGVHVKLPGKGGYAADYDPRRRSWYQRATSTYGPVWSGSYLDSDDSQLLIPCSISLRDHNNVVLGAAAIDLSVTRVARELLNPGLGAGVRAYIVDDAGQMVVHTGLTVTNAERSESSTKLPSLSDERSGHSIVGDELMVWSRLTVMDWTYIIVGPRDDLLGG